MDAAVQNRRAGLGIMATGSTIVTLTGIAAVVLTALGLAQFVPHFLLKIAIIVVGGGLFLRGMAVAGEFSRLLRYSGGRVTTGVSPSGGASTELVSGAVGIVLGVLTLLNVVPVVLAPVALVVLAVGMVVSSTTEARISKLRLAMAGTDARVHEASLSAARADSSTQILTGIGALVLAALALLGFNPWVLTLVGILSLGAMQALTGGGLATRAVGMLRSKDSRDRESSSMRSSESNIRSSRDPRDIRDRDPRDPRV
ncbi:MAG TPA: hypothetical protein VFL97_04535 [Nitrococcus sp.]|nr:hypothetical protein [Nitrococcus sp.]